MAVVIQSTAIPEAWNEWAKFIKSMLNDLDTEKNKPDEILGSMFEVGKSDRFAERRSSMTSTGNFLRVAEGANATLDDYGAGFGKTIEHEQFMSKLIITAVMREDAQWSQAKDLARQFMMGYKRTRVEFATAALCGEGATFSFGGHTFDRTTGDGKALFATNHNGKKSGVSAQSNVYTDAFSLDNLIHLANIGRNLKNQSGQIMGYDFDTIIIPGNAWQLEEQIKRVIRSDLIVGSANNDVNTQKGQWKLIVNPYWQAAAGKNPYIIMSSAANKELHGNAFWDRIPLTCIQKENVDNHNLEMSGRFRAGCGFYDWRHVIMGGATTGSSLNPAS